MKIAVTVVFLLLSFHTSASCVVLLHGLARTSSSMERLEDRLVENDFSVVNVDYFSRDFSIELLAEKVINPALKQCPENSEINFVTHSLGGILVRQYLSEHEVPNLGRVVMLGPPNQGSEAVDALVRIPGFHFMNGDAGIQLGTGDLSVPNKLGAADFDVGIIAGTKSINLILSSLIPGVDDGKVSVDRTKLDGMNDHIEIPVSHTFIMQNNAVIAQVIFYLTYGQFVHVGEDI